MCLISIFSSFIYIALNERKIHFLNEINFILKSIYLEIITFFQI